MPEFEYSRRRILAMLGLHATFVLTAPMVFRVGTALADEGGDDGGGDDGGGDDDGHDGDDDHSDEGHEGFGDHDEDAGSDTGGAAGMSGPDANVVDSGGDSGGDGGDAAAAGASQATVGNVSKSAAQVSVATTEDGDSGSECVDLECDPWLQEQYKKALTALLSAFYAVGLGAANASPDQVEIVSELAAKLISVKP